MPTKHDKEQDKRIAANSEAIERLTEYMHQIRNFHMPWAESPFQTKLRKKFIRPILKISAGVTIGMSVFKGAGVYLERQKLHTMADRYAEVATRLYNDENNPEVALPFLEKAISIDSEQPEYLFPRYQEFLITEVIRKLLLSGKSVSPLRAVDEEGCA